MNICVIVYETEFIYVRVKKYRLGHSSYTVAEQHMRQVYLSNNLITKIITIIY
jgi:hypothetical protein